MQLRQLAELPVARPHPILAAVRPFSTLDPIFHSSFRTKGVFHIVGYQHPLCVSSSCTIFVKPLYCRYFALNIILFVLPLLCCVFMLISSVYQIYSAFDFVYSAYLFFMSCAVWPFEKKISDRGYPRSDCGKGVEKHFLPSPTMRLSRSFKKISYFQSCSRKIFYFEASLERISAWRIFPLKVLGISVTNSTILGYL